jgi:flagellar L-ring protein FlgH
VKRIRVFCLLFFAGLCAAEAESLWSPDFKGYLSGSNGLAQGDTIVVAIDTASSLKFSASNNDSKTLTLEFSGGEGGDLFAFLPQVKTGGAQSAKGDSTYALKAEITALVTAVDATGRATISGSRTVALEGKEESITLTGWVNPKDVDQKGVVSLSRVGNARLTYRTFLMPAQPLLTSKDIQEIISGGSAGTAQASGAGGTSAVAGGTGTAAAAGAATGTTGGSIAGAQTRTLSLTDAKKKELLLLYLNRLMDVLFGR